MEVHGVNRPVVPRGEVGGLVEFDVFQAHIIQPAIRMSQDQAGALSMGDDVAQDDVADDARRGLIGFQGQAQAFAAPLHSEVDGVAIAPPEPVEAVGVDTIFEITTFSTTPPS